MKFEMVIVYSDEEASLLGKREAGVVKISYESPSIMQCFSPREAMIMEVKGLYNKFLRGLDEIVVD